MNLHLGFYMYGTVIPDLRSILYGEKSCNSTAGAELVTELDLFLRGATQTPPNSDYATFLRETYDGVSIDNDLHALIDRLYATGGTGTSYISPNLEDNTVCAETLLSYVSVFSQQLMIKRITPDTVEPELYSAFLRPTSIFVARQMDFVETVLARGGHAIHYESASRLQRELRLRGYFLTREQLAVK